MRERISTCLELQHEWYMFFSSRDVSAQYFIPCSILKSMQQLAQGTFGSDCGEGSHLLGRTLRYENRRWAVWSTRTLSRYSIWRSITCRDTITSDLPRSGIKIIIRRGLTWGSHRGGGSFQRPDQGERPHINETFRPRQSFQREYD
jgi:hypothetical protein